jgi:hypothetical protein
MEKEIRNNIIKALNDFVIEENIRDEQETRYDFEHKFMADNYYMEIVHDRIADKYKVEAHFYGKILFPYTDILDSYVSWAETHHGIHYNEERGDYSLETDWIYFKDIGTKVIDMIKVANSFSTYVAW